MTAFARLESNLPDVCRNLRNARSELHVSATVEVDARAAVASIKTVSEPEGLVTSASVLEHFALSNFDM